MQYLTFNDVDDEINDYEFDDQTDNLIRKRKSDYIPEAWFKL